MGIAKGNYIREAASLKWAKRGLMEDSLYIPLGEETAQNHDAYVPDAGSNELFVVTKGHTFAPLNFLT